MPNNVLIIKPNVPLILSLVDPNGHYDFTSGKGHYQTTDGRTLELPEKAVCALNLIEARPGEEIQITQHWSGKHREFPTWTVCLSARSEQARAAAGEPDTLTKQLEASLEREEQRKAPIEPPTPIRRPIKPSGLSGEQPRLFDGRGTGTHGPAPAVDPMPAPAQPIPLTAAAIRKQHEPIPANVATREILQFIEADPNTKNWSDQAKQDLCSTVLIGFLRANKIGLWERGQ